MGTHARSKERESKIRKIIIYTNANRPVIREELTEATIHTKRIIVYREYVQRRNYYLTPVVRAKITRNKNTKHKSEQAVLMR